MKTDRFGANEDRNSQQTIADELAERQWWIYTLRVSVVHSHSSLREHDAGRERRRADLGSDGGEYVEGGYGKESKLVISICNEKRFGIYRYAINVFVTHQMSKTCFSSIRAV